MGQPSLSLSDYAYDLPSNRIAESPARPRDRSRLLVVDRARRNWTDSTFQALAIHLKPGDLLVLNNTRVLKARLFGTLERTGQSVEILFADSINRHSWEALILPGDVVHKGDRIVLKQVLSSKWTNGAHMASGRCCSLDHSGPTILDILERDGHLPLPHIFVSG